MSVKVISNPEQWKQVSTPLINPASGNLLEYPKSDGQFYTLNSSGKEFRIEGNGSKIFLSQTQV